jgi:hypothetical protein
MPAISDLLASSTTTATTLNSGDGFLISQGGVSKGITWATILSVLGSSIAAGITIPSGTLMGRSSAGTGSYQALTPSSNFVFGSGTLSLTGVALVANDLSEYSGTASAARTNLGLGTISTQSAGAVALTGGTATGLAITAGSIDAAPIGANTPASLRGTSLALTGSIAASTVLVGPSGASGAPTWRMLTTADVTGAENTANKGAASGYAGLDSTGKVPLGSLPATVSGALHYLGMWNASTNSPTLASNVAPAGDNASAGGFYIVGTAGTTLINGVSTWGAGDWIVWTGSAWNKVQGAAVPVSSVAGRTGAVTLSNTDITGLGAAALLGVGAGLTSSGGAIVVSFGTTSGTVTQGNDTRVVFALQSTNNLSELNATASAARTNLGLGTISTQSAGAVALTGGTMNGVVIGASSAAAITGTTLALTASVSASYVHVGPTGSAGAPTWRMLTTADVTGAENTANKGAPSGYAPLDSTGKVPLANIPSSVIGSSYYLGVWNASTNTPTITSSAAPTGYGVGAYYVCDVAGTTSINGISTWGIGDWIIWSGTVWNKIDGSANPVTSVAGRQGAVTLTYADISGLGAAAQLSVGTGLQSVSGSLAINFGTTSGTAAQGNDSRITGALQAANALSELTGAASIARGNLGLGTISTQSAGAVALTGGTAAALAISSGTINGTPIGGVTPAAVSATTLTVTGSLAASYAHIAPTGSSGAPTWRAITTADIANAENTTNKGAAGGYAPLDGSSHVPLTNLPATVSGALHYLGTWNASTNSPTLASNTAPAGDNASAGGFYIVSTAGTTLINGVSAWGVGDWIVWTGSAWAKQVGEANPVGSVAGRTGAVTLSNTDITGLGAAALLGVGTGLTSSGGSLVVSYGTTSGTAAQGNDSRITGALQASNALSELSGSVATARTNLGLGTISTQSAGAVALTGGTMNGVVIGGSSPAAMTGTTLALTASQTASYVLAAPTSTAGAPTWRMLAAADISGLGGAATLNVGTASGTVAAGNDSRITGALQTSAIPTASLLGGASNALTSISINGTLRLSSGVLSFLAAPTETSATRYETAGGAIIYESDTTKFAFFDGTAWHYMVRADGDTMTGALTVTGTTSLATLSAASGTITGAFVIEGAATLAALSATTGSFSSTLHVTGVATLATAANINGVASGYATAGLTVGTDYGGTNETDLMVGAAGLNVYSISSGGIPSSVPLLSMNNKGQLVSIAGGQSGVAGENIATLDLTAGRVNMLKQISTTQTNSPTVNVQLSNSCALTLSADGLYPQIGALDVTAYGLTGGSACLDALIATINVYGNNAISAQDVAVQATVNQYGHDSTWGLDVFTTDWSGEPPQGFAQVGVEIDMAGNGADAATSQYDSLHNYRAAIVISPGTQGWSAWTPSTAYHANGTNSVGSIIQMTNSAGVLSIYKCTTGGTSGASAPASWPTSGTVTDNTVVWTYQQAAAYQVGRGIFLNGYGSAGAYFGTGFSSDAAYSNAVIDISEATLSTSINANAAAIRIAANQAIDFSGNGTLAGQNLHTLSYSSVYSSLYYNVSGQNRFQIKDTGALLAFGTFNCASNSTISSLHSVTSGYLGGLTVGVNYAGTGETDFMVDTAGLQIYAVQSGGTLSSVLFSMDGSGDTAIAGSLSSGGIAHLATLAGGIGSLHGATTFSASGGLIVGSDYNGSGELDFLINTGGLGIYAVQSGGTLSSVLFNLDGSGNATIAGNLTCGGEAHFGTLSGGSGSLHGMTTFSTSGGLIVGSGYSGVDGETDFLVNTTGLSIYAVQSSGTLSSALFTIDGSGDVGIAGTLNVTGAASLAALSATNATFTGTMSVSGNVTLGGAILAQVSGSTTAQSSGLPSLDFLGSTINFQRKVSSGNPTYAGTRVFLDNYSSAYTVQSWGGYSSVPAFSVTATSHPGANGSTVGVAAILNSNGSAGYAAQECAITANVTKTGTNGTWALATQSVDNTGLTPTAFSLWGVEIDLLSNGPDSAASAYTYSAAARQGILIAAKPNPVNTYAANTPFSVGQLIAETPSAGVSTVFICTTAGTTGSTAPTWNGTYGATVTDGTVVWTTGVAYATTIGTGIQIGSASGATINTGMWFNGQFNNAFLDFSGATLGGSNSAAIRLASGMVIDFTGNATSAGQNIRTLGYSNYASALQYVISGTVSWAANNAGNFFANGQTILGGGAAANLSGVTTGFSNTALTIGRNSSTYGEIDLITGSGGIDFIATNGSGVISSPYLTASPTGLTAYGKLSVSGITNLGNGSGANIYGVTTGFGYTGISFGYNAADLGDTDILFNNAGLYFYPVSSSGTISSPAAILTGAGALRTYGITNLGNGSGANIGSVTTGFSNTGITFAYNAGLTGDTDVLFNNAGLYFYPVSSSGTISNAAATLTSSLLSIEGHLNAPLATPASSSAAGTAGTVQWDANYVYVCTATNTWKRAALSTF